MCSARDFVIATRTISCNVTFVGEQIICGARFRSGPSAIEKLAQRKEC